MPPSPLVPACCGRPPGDKGAILRREEPDRCPAETRHQRRWRARRDPDLPPRMAHHRTAAASLAGRAHRPPRLRCQQLRDDLDRFIFLLGGNDGERLITSDTPEEGEPRDY